MRSVVVAFSGGVDSAYLAWAATEVLGDSVALRHRRQPELSGAPPPARAASRARRSACSTKSSSPAKLERAEYRANPGEPLLLLQARALHAPDATRARARLRVCRRRQQRRRSRRLPSRPPGGARVRRAQPARRSRADQGRDSRAVARSPACPCGTSRRRRACRRAFRIITK